jgi:predicted pyridoxine 5'-phosphate oxidase superfamily flavin-nucleotide-binding protein
MEITVKHEFTMSPELEAFFSRVMAPMLEKSTADLPAPLKQMALLEAVEDLKDLEKAIAPKKEEVKPTTATTTDITVEQLRAVVSEKASAKTDNRAKIKQLLTELGAENVTSLDKAKYSEFLTAVNAL